MDPRFTQKTRQIWRWKDYDLWVTSNTEVPGTSVKWMVPLIVPNSNRCLPPSIFPTTRRGQIFQQDGAPCHTSGSTMKFLRGKKIKVLQRWPAQSPDMNIIEHIWGRMKEEAWRTKPNNLEELWDACKVAFYAIPDDFINKLSAKPDGNCSAGQRNPYKILII